MSSGHNIGDSKHIAASSDEDQLLIELAYKVVTEHIVHPHKLVALTQEMQDQILVAAEKGNPKAQLILGYYASLVPGPTLKAESWLQKAADNNDPYAQLYLWILYVDQHAVVHTSTHRRYIDVNFNDELFTKRYSYLINLILSQKSLPEDLVKVLYLEINAFFFWNGNLGLGSYNQYSQYKKDLILHGALLTFLPRPNGTQLLNDAIKDNFQAFIEIFNSVPYEAQFRLLNLPLGDKREKLLAVFNAKKTPEHDSKLPSEISNLIFEYAQPDEDFNKNCFIGLVTSLKSLLGHTSFFSKSQPWKHELITKITALETTLKKDSKGEEDKSSKSYDEALTNLLKLVVATLLNPTRQEAFSKIWQKCFAPYEQFMRTRLDKAYASETNKSFLAQAANFENDMLAMLKNLEKNCKKSTSTMAAWQELDIATRLVLEKNTIEAKKIQLATLMEIIEKHKKHLPKTPLMSACNKVTQKHQQFLDRHVILASASASRPSSP